MAWEFLADNPDLVDKHREKLWKEAEKKKSKNPKSVDPRRRIYEVWKLLNPWTL